MRILYGTGNPAKLSAMRRQLEGLGIELVGLCDLDGEIPSPPENGNTPLENARLKAECYFRTFHMPVFSCDSGLYFENVPDGEQPGVHVRNVNGRCLTDGEMLDYYGGLARKYGDLTAKYKNAICFIKDDKNRYEAMDKSMESEKFILTAEPHSSIRKEGFPLDSLSVDIRTGRYFYDLPAEELDEIAVGDGFLDFFKRYL